MAAQNAVAEATQTQKKIAMGACAGFVLLIIIAIAVGVSSSNDDGGPTVERIGKRWHTVERIGQTEQSRLLVALCR